VPTLNFQSQSFPFDSGESVLDTLLRNGVPVSYSCKAGNCGACMLRAVDGEIPASAQAGLKDSWIAKGYFLACCCRPSDHLAVVPLDADARIAATIADITSIAVDVLRLRLRTEPFAFRAGQYVTVSLENGLARSYSIASLPGEEYLEMHIRLLPNGRMSNWLRNEAQPGSPLQLMGPHGDCFYTPGQAHRPLLLIGTGTGLAPLYGILRDALRNGHHGPIHLFHGARQPAGFYLNDGLSALAREHTNFQYTPTISPIDQTVAEHYPKPKETSAFLCGDPTLVQLLRKKLFLAGMDLRDIHADAFLPST